MEAEGSVMISRQDAAESTLHEQVSRQAARSPDAIAVECRGESLTYRELDTGSNRLAHHLRELGLGPNELVGIHLERSLSMVVALLATLKAGGAYVPADPAYPQERIRAILEDSDVRVLITESRLAPPFSMRCPEAVCLDRDRSTIERQPADVLDDRSTSDDLAYVIYTSGTTGKPKGVAIQHRAMVNFLRSMQTEPGLTPDDVLLAVTTLSFDIAGLELFLPLVSGARVLLATRETAVDGFALLREIHEGWRGSLTTVSQNSSIW